MTEARRIIFIRLLKVITENIRYERAAIKQHQDFDISYECPLWQHERDLNRFRWLHSEVLSDLKAIK